MLRNLKTSDIFKMSKILKQMKLKIDVKDKTQSQVGAELIVAVFENLHLAEDSVNEFLADLSGMKKEEFANLEFEKAMEIIKEFKSIPAIASFFKQANQLTK